MVTATRGPIEVANAAELDRLHVLGPRSLRTLTLRERDPLSLPEVLETDAFASRHVEEEIVAGTGLNESEALVRQTLDSAFSHSFTL